MLSSGQPSIPVTLQAHYFDSNMKPERYQGAAGSNWSGAENDLGEQASPASSNSALPTPKPSPSPFREVLAAEMANGRYTASTQDDSDDEEQDNDAYDGQSESDQIGATGSLGDHLSDSVPLTQDMTLDEVDITDPSVRTLAKPLFIKTGSAGGVRILQLGRYTTTLSQYPNDFKCVVKFHDWRDQSRMIWYTASILSNGKYELRPIDVPNGKVFVATTATTLFKSAVSTGQRLNGGTYSLSGPRKMGLNHPLVLRLFKDMWDLDQPGKRNHGGRRGDTTTVTVGRVRIGDVPAVNTYESRLRSSRSASSGPAPVRAPEDFYAVHPSHLHGQQGYTHGWQQIPAYGYDGGYDSDHSETDPLMVDQAGYQNKVPLAHHRVLQSPGRSRLSNEAAVGNRSSADREAIEALTGLMFGGGGGGGSRSVSSRNGDGSGDSSEENNGGEGEQRGLKRRRTGSVDETMAEPGAASSAEQKTPVLSSPFASPSSSSKTATILASPHTAIELPAALPATTATQPTYMTLLHQHRQAIARLEDIFATLFSQLASLHAEISQKEAILAAFNRIESDGSDAVKSEKQTVEGQLAELRKSAFALEAKVSGLVGGEHAVAKDAQEGKRVRRKLSFEGAGEVVERSGPVQGACDAAVGEKAEVPAVVDATEASA